MSKEPLKAPGKLTISGLELVQGKGAFGTFMGLPRDFAVASLKNKDNKITVTFVLARVGGWTDGHLSGDSLIVLVCRSGANEGWPNCINGSRR